MDTGIPAVALAPEHMREATRDLVLFEEENAVSVFRVSNGACHPSHPGPDDNDIEFLLLALPRSDEKWMSLKRWYD